MFEDLKKLREEDPKKYYFTVNVISWISLLIVCGIVIACVLTYVK